MIHHYQNNVTITSSEIVDSVIKISGGNFVNDYNLLSLKVSIDYTLVDDFYDFNHHYSYLPIPLNLSIDTTYYLKQEPPADPPNGFHYFTIYTEKEFTNQIEFTENDLANCLSFVVKLHNKYYAPQEVIFSAVADTLDVVCCPEQPTYQTTDFVKQVDFTFNGQPFTLIAKAQPTYVSNNQLMLFYLSCDNFRVGQWEHSASLEISYTDANINLIDITVTAKFYVWDWQELIDDPVYYNKAYFIYKLETQINDFELSVTLDLDSAISYSQIFGAGEPPATLAIVFSGQMQFPDTLRIVLEDAFFPTGSIYTELYDDSEPSEIQLGNIDELLTYDPNLNSYVSDVLTLYGIEGRFIVDTILQEGYAWNTVLKKSSLIDDDVKRFLYPLASLNHKFLLHLSAIPSKLYPVYSEIPFLISYAKGSYMPFEIPATTVNHGLEVGDMIIDSRIVFLLQEDIFPSILLGFFNLSDTDGFGNPLPHKVTRVKFASIKSLRKPNPFNRIYLNFEDDHDLITNLNTFYDSELIVTSNSLNSYFTTLVGSPSPLSVVTFNDDAIEDNAETLIIDGTDFYADNPFANIVVFNLGAEGFVSAATTTQLTVTFTTQPTSLGNLTAIIKNPFASGAAVQVATVVAGIVVTTNSDYLARNAPTLVIAGSGFSATANQNTVTFNLGAVGTVTSATTTELTITFSTQPTSTGSLTAVVAVSTSNGDSGTAIEVATIVTYGSLVLIDTISILNKGYSSLKPSYDGLSVYGLDYLNFSIDNYDRNLSTGILELDNTVSTVFDQPFEMFVTSDDLILVFSFYGPGYEIYTRALSYPIGALSLQNSVEIDSYYVGNGIVISNNENNFYWGGESINNGITIWNFKIDAINYDASIESNILTDYAPSLLAISPDGKNIYSESYYNFNYYIEIFDRENQDGDLTKNIDNEINIIAPVKVVVSPDNLFVYVFLDNGTNNPPIKIFARNTTTGSLTLDDTIYPNIGSFKDAIISIDGKNCYLRTQVATPPSTIDYYLILGTIDNQTGGLTFSTQYEVSYGDFNATIESFDEQFIYAASGSELLTYARIT